MQDDHQHASTTGSPASGSEPAVRPPEAETKKPAVRPPEAETEKPITAARRVTTILRRLISNQWVVGIVLLLIGVWIGAYQQSQRPLRLGQSGELVDFVITPLSIKCEPAPNDEVPANPEPTNICSVPMKVINNSNESRTAQDLEFILYVGDNRFKDHSYNSDLSGREIFPDGSRTGVIAFRLPPTATPTKLEVTTYNWNFLQFILPFLRRPLVYDLR
jgi:hypothetical protein